MIGLLSGLFQQVAPSPEPHTISLIGPSGSGKTTLLKSLKALSEAKDPPLTDAKTIPTIGVNRMQIKSEQPVLLWDLPGDKDFINLWYRYLDSKIILFLVDYQQCQSSDYLEIVKECLSNLGKALKSTNSSRKSDSKFQFVLVFNKVDDPSGFISPPLVYPFISHILGLSCKTGWNVKYLYKIIQSNLAHHSQPVRSPLRKSISAPSEIYTGISSDTISQQNLSVSGELSLTQSTSQSNDSAHHSTPLSESADQSADE